MPPQISTFKTSQLASNQILTILLEKTNSKISQKVIKQQLPQKLKKQNIKTFDHITHLHQLVPQQNTGTDLILQNSQLKKDNLSFQDIPIIVPQVKPSSRIITPNNSRRRNKSIFSNGLKIRQNSGHSQPKSKFSSKIDEKQQHVKQKKFKQLPKKMEMLSFSIDLLRIRMINISELNKKQGQQQKRQNQQRKQKKTKMQTKARSMKNYTFDYDCNFFKIEGTKDDLQTQKVKAQVVEIKQLTKQQICHKIKQTKPRPIQINNRKIQERKSFQVISQRLRSLSNQNVLQNNQNALQNNQNVLQNDDQNDKFVNKDRRKTEGKMQASCRSLQSFLNDQIHKKSQYSNRNSNNNNKQQVSKSKSQRQKQMKPKYRTLQDFNKQSLKFHKFYHQINRNKQQNSSRRVTTQNPEIKTNRTAPEQCNKKQHISKYRNIMTSKNDSSMSYFSSFKKLKTKDKNYIKSRGKIIVSNKQLFQQTITDFNSHHQ